MSSLKSAQKPLYELIQNDIIEKIQKGYYKPGDQVPSEKDIMLQHNVSRITATKALTELSLNGYIYRVQGKGSFVNPPGKQFRASELAASFQLSNEKGPKKIALIIPEFYDYHSGNIISSVMKTLQYPDYFVCTVLNLNNLIEEYALNFFQKNSFSGILLFPSDCEFYSEIILKMRLSKFPLVLIDRSFPGIYCNSVTSNNKAGSEMAVKHLISLGHRNIAFIADSTYKEQITSVRHNGYIQTILSHELKAIDYENFSHGETSAKTQETFVQEVKSGAITAIIASNSHVALDVYHLCQKGNIRIPQDLSVICFDNPNFYQQEKTDFFSYVDQDSSEIGRQASHLMIKSLTGDGIEECSQIVLEPKLVINRSTCPPKPFI